MMDNDIINAVLWILAWVAIATLRYSLDQAREAMAQQINFNKVQSDINRQMGREIDRLKQKIELGSWLR